MKKSSKIISWIFQIIVAAILFMTLPAKFSGAEGPVALFTQLGMEPHGRYLTGSIELLACLLILIPASVVYGAFLAAGVMVGAIIGHITELGFEGENGILGTMAIGVFVSSLVVLYIRRRQLPIISRMFDSERDT
ncbi:MAG: putative membrane protein YphA (DoxX/SURF4 family) [Cryomorphaceae bacterium]|jgi:uncharacterized membrane protein YphA (DoxX/SURF4 family)